MPQRARVWISLLLITGLLEGALAAGIDSSSQQADRKYDCEKGCPLTTYPVCSSDGEWYQNACMAYCAHATVDSSADACGGAPMPFADSKPGPHGAESGRPTGFVRLIDKAVINAFKGEGLRYVGRIRLAREMGPRPRNIGSNMRLPEPEIDRDGNWRVGTLRCTADGDVYKGIMSVPMTAMDLKAFEPNRLLGNWFKGSSSSSSKANKAHPADKPAAGEQLLQEAGSYDSDSANTEFSDAPGATSFDPSRHTPHSVKEQVVQQPKKQWQNPLGFLWGKMREAADGLSSLVRPASAAASNTTVSSTSAGAAGLESGSSSSSSTGQEPVDTEGDNAALFAPPTAAEELAAAGGAHTISFEPAQAQSASLAAAAAAADGPIADVAASTEGTDAEAEADAELLSEVMGDVTEDGVVTAAYAVGGNSTSPGRRRLLEIINGDDRFICEKGYPYTAIGQIQVVDNTGLYICTGVLIRPNKVLTAAHCVWNTKRNAFYYNLNFAPGRYRHDGKMVNPWGVVPWKSVTVFDAFKKDPSTWDVAVVTLSKNLGSVTGYMGMAAGCSSKTELTLAGYPQDQAQGTCMANTCTIPYLDCNALTNIHTCDTIMGMSGSPLWDNKNRIRMIHVAGIAGRPENRGTTVTQFLVNTISKW